MFHWIGFRWGWNTKTKAIYRDGKARRERTNAAEAIIGSWLTRQSPGARRTAHIRQLSRWSCLSDAFAFMETRTLSSWTLLWERGVVGWRRFGMVPKSLSVSTLTLTTSGLPRKRQIVSEQLLN